MNGLTRKCPECGSTKIILTREGLICEKCGLVISEAIYSGKMMLV